MVNVMRVILYTGKGGVGKTSIAAITACNLAEEGNKTIIMSTDQAHSLGDSFDVKLGNEAITIANNLDALEVDVVNESEDAWGNMKSYLKKMLLSKSSGEIETEELLVFPGLEELFALFKILDIFESKIYDVVIVDCAPTGETLSLLKYPEMFGNLIERVLPIERKMTNFAGPFVEKLTKIPMPTDDVFSDVEKLMDKLKRLQNLMLDKDILSIRIVTTTEKIVVKEAKRNFTCLHLFDYNVDAIIVNKVYPKEALTGYFNQWVKLQEDGLCELKQAFCNIPMFILEMQSHELKSMSVLKVVRNLYGEYNPAAIFCKEQIFKVHQEDETYKMDISIPFADKDELELEQDGGELYLSIKNEKRCFAMPDILNGKEISAAKYEEGVLRITFQ